jgi:hypothetical protein
MIRGITPACFWTAACSRPTTTNQRAPFWPTDQEEHAADRVTHVAVTQIGLIRAEKETMSHCSPDIPIRSFALDLSRHPILGSRWERWAKLGQFPSILISANSGQVGGVPRTSVSQLDHRRCVAGTVIGIHAAAWPRDRGGGSDCAVAPVSSGATRRQMATCRGA